MSKLFLLFLIVLPGFCLGQARTPTKRELVKAFKNSVKPDNQKEWLACNADSAYYEAKIIKLYNGTNYLYDPQHCCNHISWNFINNKTFDLRKILICQEPPLSVILKNSIYHIEVKSERKKLILSISNGIQNTRFQVLSLEAVMLWNKRDEVLVLTLERI